MFGRRALIAALVLLFGVVGAQAGSESRAHNFTPEGLAKVSDYIRNEIATGKFPGAILLLQQHGKPVYYENFGVRDVATEHLDERGHDLPALFDVEADHLLSLR